MKPFRPSDKGVFLVMLAIMLIPIIGIVAFAIDLSMANVVKTEAQTAADLSALAAVSRLARFSELAAIQGAAQNTANENHLMATAEKINLHNDDIETGIYDFKKETFKLESDLDNPLLNAVRVTVSLGKDAANPPFSVRYARLLGFRNIPIQVQSIAVHGNRNVELVFEISGSMDEGTYPSYLKEGVSNGCYSAVDPLTDPFKRNFKNAARPEWDEENCLGGLPQPIFRVFTVARESLLANPLFNSHFRAGLLTYSTNVSEEVKLPEHANAHENKQKLDSVLQDALDDWTTYAASSGGEPANIFPGGSTNTGRAIQTARDRFKTINEEHSEVPTLNVLILLSDGVSNCPPASGCDDTSAGRVLGKAYAISEAKLAALDHIVIHAIYFGEPDSEGSKHMKEIATANGGVFYNATDVDSLRDIFDRLNQSPPFVIVIPKDS